MYSRISCEATLGLMPQRGPARPWPVHPAEPRFIGKHDPQQPARVGPPSAAPSLRRVGSGFFKIILGRKVASETK
jgi:hypothetical protein